MKGERCIGQFLGLERATLIGTWLLSPTLQDGGSGNMRRREFVTLTGGAALGWPLAARAQRAERMRRIGVLMGYAEGDREGQAFVAAFREELRNLTWIEGSNVAIDVRWGAGNEESTQRFAADLVALKPDL